MESTFGMRKLKARKGSRPWLGPHLPNRNALATLPWIIILAWLAAAPTPAFSETPAGLAAQTDLSSRKIFFMLFLMLGPIKILVPFVNMTKGCQAVLRRQIARRSILFSAAALIVAGLLGQRMLDTSTFLFRVSR